MTKAQAEYLIDEFGSKDPRVTLAWVPQEKALQIHDKRDGQLWNSTDYHDTMEFLKTL